MKHPLRTGLLPHESFGGLERCPRILTPHHGGTHPGLSALEVLACLYHDACCQMGWLHAVRGHTSRSVKTLQDISNISRLTVRHGCLSTRTARRMVRRHKSTCLLSASSLFKLTLCYKRAMFDQSHHHLALQAASGHYYSALSPPLVNCGMQAGLKSDKRFFAVMTRAIALLLRWSENFRNGFSFSTLSVSFSLR